jgi:MoaA/NifB/PqqE/SkfB family radical SAM enzyme
VSGPAATASTQQSELDRDAGPTPWIGPHGRRMERLELHLSYHCPEACVFCSEAHRMERFAALPVSWGRVAAALRLHAGRGVRAVHLTGGEPTIHPRFLDTLRLARRLEMQTSVGSIGTRLCRPDFAAAALPLLDLVLLSLHGPDAATHDALAGREGSFAQVCAALRLAAAHGGPLVGVNTVLTRANLDRLPETAALAAQLGARLVVVSNTSPEGGASVRWDALSPPLAALAEVLPRVPAAAAPATVRFFGVPMCLLGPHWPSSNDLHWDPRVTVEWQERGDRAHFAGIYSWAPDRGRVHVEACRDCVRNTVCTGVFARAVAAGGVAALRPTRALSAGSAGGPPPRG